MSLLVWLPLNGDLNNQGVSNITISKATEVTLNTAGKIGTCASCETSGKTITATVPGLANILANGQSYSVCAWVKRLNHGTSGWICQIGTTNYTGLWWTNASSNPRIIWNENDGGKRCANDELAGDYDIWHHFAIVVTKTASGQITIEYYTDGARSTSYPGRTWDGSSQSVPTGNTLTLLPYTAAINDFRIYSHALSPAEVHEISQGLVLHYRLDNSLKESNWLTSSAPLTITRSSGNTFGDVAYNSTLNSSTETAFTVECDVKGTAADMYFDVYFRNSSGQAYAVTAKTLATTDWKHYILPLNGSPTNLQIFRVRCYSGTSGDKIEIRDIRLYSNNMPITGSIRDSSGYGHNGSIIGTPTLSSNTARYSSSMQFNGSNQAINAYRGAMVTDAITASCWAYMPTWTASNKTLISCAESQGWGMKPTSNSLRFVIVVNNSSNITLSATSSKTYASLSAGWHLFTGTYNGTVAKLYIDGVLEATSNTITKGIIQYNSGNSLFIGAEAGTSNTTPKNEYFAGNISDVRVYATALSADDIKQLYQVGAKVDNLGNWHTFEFKENNGIAKITKMGITEANEVYDNMNFNNRAQIVKNNATVLITGDLNIVTTYSSSNKTGTIASLPAATVQSLAGKTLRLIYDVCTTGARYSTEQGQTAYNYTRYGIHGSCTMDGSTSYPFAGYLNYSGNSIHVIQTWTIPTGKTTYGALSFAIQNFDKPSSTNNATWFIRNVRLEVVDGTSDNITGTNLIEK